MRDAHVFALAVKKRHPDDACSILAVQDLVRGVLILGRLPKEVNVYGIMTKQDILRKRYKCEL